ncbi:endolytic transglycosylase MltG [Virgibacillus halodenitrificans]|uniref:endolytic transglycosylase MltG n=1 Tax=Virgibacillus halodenitrificans TaxID=1482 RepID=UPI001F19AC68|nr:endolytic transglycosylase MltG [Virgibacillus halodenitrificans]MCJ0930855.1 endolytic transglycosylase MltG [Virgibacillus halodenitrificans]WHX27517.1 endolytic transglycosylase MltG [Virgibacillus halodenitrificans]
MKQPIRAFAIGLLTSGVIMLIGFFFWGTTSAKDEMTAEEMIPLVKEEGYHVLSQEEYISLSVEKDKQRTDKKEEKASEKKTENKKEEADEKEQTDEEEASDKPTKYKINIKSGMATSEISNLLEEKKIIKDSGKFDKYLEKENYSEKVQIGEFEVSSDMSFYELAEKIAR